MVAALAHWRQELFGAGRLQQLGVNFMDELVAGFSVAAIAAPGTLDNLIADRVINHYAGGVVEQMPTANGFPIARTPDILSKTKPEQVLNGLGLDAQVVQSAVAEGGLAALAGLQVTSAEMSREPLSSTKEDLAVVQAALTQRIENVAVQAIGKLPGTPAPKSKSTGKKGAAPSSTRRRKDDLDRLIDRAVAARRSENGEQR